MKSTRIGRLALLTAALIWGSSFVIMKDTVANIPVYRLLAIRFTIAALGLAVIFAPRLRGMTKELLKHGGVCGVLLLAAYAIQTFGLMDTTPGTNAFLTAVYCVLVPFLAWAMTRQCPAPRNWLAALTCLAGIGLISLTGNFTIGKGDALTLLGGVFYALHIIALTRYTGKHDAIALTVVQFAAVAVISWGLTLLTEAPFSWPQTGWPQLIYLAVFCTGVTLVLQSVGQKLTPPGQAAILLSLESVFGVLLSVVTGAETVSLRMGCGFALIFAAVLISEIEWPKRAKL